MSNDAFLVAANAARLRIRKIRIEGVTLVAIIRRQHKQTINAVVESIRYLSFDRVVLLWSESDKGDVPLGVVESYGIVVEEIPPIESQSDESLFLLKELHKYIDTDFVLTVGSNGYVVNPTRWNEDWKDFDFVGAPISQKKTTCGNRVGYAGFSLRSKRMLEATANLCDGDLLEKHKRLYGGAVVEHVLLCCDLRESFVEMGIRFADPATAAAFSFAEPTEFMSLPVSFGFEGSLHPATKSAMKAIRKRACWERKKEQVRNPSLHPVVPCQGGSGPMTEDPVVENSDNLLLTLDQYKLAKPSLVPRNKRISRSRIAAVLCYFNPSNSKLRRICLQRTAEHLKQGGWDVCLVVGYWDDSEKDGLSLNVDHCWELPLTEDQIFFVKESLLNYAISRLVDDYEALAFVDSDIVFERIGNGNKEDSKGAVLDTLQRHKACQLGQFVRYINGRGWASKWNMLVANYCKTTGRRGVDPSKTLPGFGWAFRSDVLRDAPLYDRMVFGGGDVVIAGGAIGSIPRQWMRRLSKESAIDVERYVRKLSGLVRGSFSAAPLLITHHYHGSLKNRGYVSRYETCRSCNFDPNEHLTRDNRGIVRWSDKAPDKMKKALRDYMLVMRKEG